MSWMSFCLKALAFGGFCLFIGLLSALVATGLLILIGAGSTDSSGRDP